MPSRRDNGRPQFVIGLLWHSINSDNLGIGALTASHMAIVEEIAREAEIDVRFVVMGWRDSGPAYIHSPNLTSFPMRARDLVRPGGLYAAVRQCDIVLDISAGDSFADIYGKQRFAYNAIAKGVVLMARRRLVLAPQTVGPFERRWTRVVAGMLMRFADAVVTRDGLTTEFLEPFGLTSKLFESTDVAFRLPYDPPPMRNCGRPIRFGFNVSGLLFNGGYTRSNMFSLRADYSALARSVLRHFSALADCEVHLIGHVNSKRFEVEDDYRVSQQLASEFPNAVVAPRFNGPSEAKSYIASMDFFCGSRMHACIAAFSSGVPVLPIAYSRKFAGVFSSLGYELVADCRTQTADEILREVVKCFEMRHALRDRVADGQAVANEKLRSYHAVLRTILQKVAP